MRHRESSIDTIHRRRFAANMSDRPTDIIGTGTDPGRQVDSGEDRAVGRKNSGVQPLRRRKLSDVPRGILSKARRPRIGSRFQGRPRVARRRGEPWRSSRAMLSDTYRGTSAAWWYMTSIWSVRGARLCTIDPLRSGVRNLKLIANTSLRDHD